MAGLEETNSSNPCKEYQRDEYMYVAIIAASTGTFSMLASIAVISVIVILKKYNFFIQRLILYLCITAALNATSITLRFSRMGNESSHLHRLCIMTAFLDQTTLWSLDIAFCCMTFNMLLTAVFNKSTKRLEIAYIFGIFLLPITYNWIPFLSNSYGEAGAWCWIRSHDYHDGNCTNHMIGLYMQYALWYVPHNLVLALLLVAYIVVVVNVIRKKHHWKGLYSSTEVQPDQLNIKEFVMPIIFYPLGFLVLNIFPLINRISSTIEDTPIYALWVLHAACSPLQGGYIALVYVLDRDTLRRLTLRELRAYLFHRQTPVNDYPVTRAFTDSYDANKFSPDVTTSANEDDKVLLGNRLKDKHYGSTEGSRLLKYNVKSEKV